MSYTRNQWDRIAAWLCISGGVVALIAGYLGVSGTLDTGKQLPYVVSGGMTGLFLLGLGALLWLSADLRDEWRKLDALDRHLVECGRLPAPSPEWSIGRDRLTEGNGQIVPPEAPLR